MIHTIGVKPTHSSILDLKKELLFFDQIHFFGDNAAWSLAEILIPEDTKVDDISAMKYAMQEVDKLMRTGKTDNKLLTQVFTEYNTLTELNIVIAKSESEILDPALKNKNQFKKISKTGNIKEDEFNNMNHLIVLMNDALKKFGKITPEPLKGIKQFKNLEDIPLEGLLEKDLQAFIEYDQLISELSSETIARLYSFVMSYDKSTNFVPILNRLSDWKSADTNETSLPSPKLRVINAVFNSMPMPNANTPLEEVLDFKKDAEAKGHILALNNWIIDASTKNLSVTEIEQKIEYLISEYEKFIRINKLKFEASKFEIVVTSIAEVAENLARLKFSKVSQSIFQLFKNDVKLLEAEMNAPGKEIAYLSSARQKFGNK